jgi:hypothetical protein
LCCAVLTCCWCKLHSLLPSKAPPMHLETTLLCCAVFCCCGCRLRARQPSSTSSTQLRAGECPWAQWNKWPHLESECLH